MACKLLSDLTQGLQYLHEQCVVHRDIKPENVLLSSTPCMSVVARFCDFGLARSVIHGNYCRTLCGAPFYMAPELAWSKWKSRCNTSNLHYGMEVDLWAFGIVWYCAFCGELPCDDTYPKCVAIQLHKHGVSFSDCMVPVEIQCIIEDLLSFSSEQRLTAFQLAARVLYV